MAIFNKYKDIYHRIAGDAFEDKTGHNKECYINDLTAPIDSITAIFFHFVPPRLRIFHTYFSMHTNFYPSFFLNSIGNKDRYRSYNLSSGGI